MNIVKASVYNIGWSIRDSIERGFNSIRKKVTSIFSKHITDQTTVLNKIPLKITANRVVQVLNKTTSFESKDLFKNIKKANPTRDGWDLLESDLGRVTLTVNGYSIKDKGDMKVLRDNLPKQSSEAIARAIGQNLLGEVGESIYHKVKAVDNDLIVQGTGMSEISIDIVDKRVRIVGTETYNISKGFMNTITKVPATVSIIIPNIDKFNENDPKTFTTKIRLEEASTNS